jgi:alpha-1,2-mannosyltransferase
MVLGVPAQRRRRIPAVSLRHAIGFLACSVAVFCVVRAVSPHRILGDLMVYRAEGLALRQGLELYGPLPGVHNPATYPTFAALAFVPLTLLPVSALQVLCMALNLMLLLVVCKLSCDLVGVRGRRTAVTVCCTAALALWSEPVLTNIAYGQINLLLLGLVLFDFTRPSDSRLRGIGTGLAAAIKVTPAILIVYLLLTRRWRAAITALITVAVSIAVSALPAAKDTWLFWTRYLFEWERVGRIGIVANQSIRGLLVRVEHTRTPQPVPLAAALTAVMLALGLLCAARAYRTLGDSWGLPAAAVTGLLVSPVSWTHHWVWCVPIGVLLWFRARRWFAVAVLAFWSWVVWTFPHVRTAELHFAPVVVVLSGWYVYFGVWFLGFTAWQVHKARQARQAPPAEPRSAQPPPPAPSPATRLIVDARTTAPNR